MSGVCASIWCPVRGARDELVQRLVRAVARDGLRELLPTYTGAGRGAVDFGWSGLIVEMVQPDPRAASSYATL